MSIEEIKSASLSGYLSIMGYRPVRRAGGKEWYLSPLHEETCPSFKVNLSLNLWYDHALSRGGNIINLAAALHPGMDMHGVLSHLTELILAGRLEISSYSNEYETRQKKEGAGVSGESASPPTTAVLSLCPIRHPALVGYLRERGIPMGIAGYFCREIRYRDLYSGREYFGISFRNDLGGYEVRSRYGKRCVGGKSHTFLPNLKGKETTSCCIFEGFFDLMSYFALEGGEFCVRFEKCHPDLFVLNSVSTLGAVIPLLARYTSIYIFFDNDSAGETASNTAASVYGNRVKNMSFLYAPLKDLNEWLVKGLPAGGK